MDWTQFYMQSNSVLHTKNDMKDENTETPQPEKLHNPQCVKPHINNNTMTRGQSDQRLSQCYLSACC